MEQSKFPHLFTNVLKDPYFTYGHQEWIKQFSPERSPAFPSREDVLLPGRSETRSIKRVDLTELKHFPDSPNVVLECNQKIRFSGDLDQWPETRRRPSQYSTSNYYMYLVAFHEDDILSFSLGSIYCMCVGITPGCISVYPKLLYYKLAGM